MSALTARNTMNGSTEPHVAPIERCILVTGGAGYIGSHTAIQLLSEGYRVVIVDNLDNSVEEAVERVRDLAGKLGRNLYFYRVRSRNTSSS